MRLALINREKLQALGSALVSEFDNLVARIRAGWNVEHNEEGGHGEVHAETITTGRLVFSEVVTLPLLAAVSHNLDPPGLSTASVLRIDPLVNGATISGLRVPQDEAGVVLDGRVLVLENVTETGKCFKIAQENSPNGNGSSPRNRFRIPWQPLSLNAIAEFVVHPSSFVTLMYNASKARWLIASQRSENTSAFMAFSTSQNNFAFGTSPRAMRTWRLIPEVPDLWVSGFANDQLPEDEKKTLVNDGRYTVQLLHASPSSDPASRIYCPGGIRYLLHPRESVELQYIRGGTGGWRILLKADQWVDVPFVASDFTGNVGTWTVAPAQVTTFIYQIDGNKMTVSFTLGGGTTVAGNPVALQIRIPDARIASRSIWQQVGFAADGGGARLGALVLVAPNQPYLFLYVDSSGGTPWTGTVTVYGQLTFMIGEDAAIAEAHTDVAHADAAHADAEHADITHVDVAHVDTHTDTPHADASHTDTIHQDAHSDTHSDVTHADTHSDAAHVDVPHSDGAHSDVPANPPVHQDVHFDTHGDRPHTDVPFNDTPFNNSHSDQSHADFHVDEITNHEDSHTDQSHNDNHVDIPGSSHTDNAPHGDAHGDQSGGQHFDNHWDTPTHTDTHGDTSQHGDAHDDIPHSDAHTDQGHGDSGHSDVSHQDAAHEDGHVDFATPGNPHSDVPHADSHSDVVHGDSHGDVIHQDAHTDTHTDVAHLDSGHSDAAHTDGHNDAPHNDTTHVDQAHADTVHGDSAHQDVGLHTDAAHADL